MHKLAEAGKIANCESKNGKLVSIDLYKVYQDTKLEEQIAKKYKAYVAKTALIGCKMAFDYRRGGDQVKLIRYIGKTKDVVIPNFITSIIENAFMNCKLNTLTLDNGLTYIGGQAFDSCELREVTIPETIEIICDSAFIGNKRLVTENGEYRNKIKLLNRRTKIRGVH